MGMRGDMHGGMHEGAMGMMPFGRHIDRLLDDVKATDAQRQQIKQITDKARSDVMALHEQGKGLHERAASLWTAPKIDAAEAEKLRQQMLGRGDLELAALFDVQLLDHAVLDQHRIALRALAQAEARTVQHQTQGAGQLAVAVGKHDDAVDSTTQAVRYLRERGFLNRQEDVLAGVNSRAAYKKPTRPIYDT